MCLPAMLTTARNPITTTPATPPSASVCNCSPGLVSARRRRNASMELDVCRPGTYDGGSCMSASRSPRGARDSTRDRLTFFQLVTGLSLADVLLCPMVYRDALFASFYQAHFPEMLTPSGRDGAMGNSLRALLSPQSEPMGLAVDALLLKQLGKEWHDPQILHEAETRRHAALHYLRTLITLNQTGAVGERLLVMIFTLSIYDSEDDYPERLQAYQSHVAGLRATLLALGPSAILKNELCRKILISCVPLFLIEGFALKQASFLEEPAWQSALEQIGSGRVSSLFRLSCSMPRLLKEVDKIASRDKSVTWTRAATAMAHLEDLDSRLQQWLWDWYLEEPFNLPPPEASISSPAFAGFVAKQASTANVFSKVPCFASFVHAMAHVNYWTLRLHIRRAMMVCSLSLGLTPADSTALASGFQRQLAGECADELCRCIIPVMCSELASITHHTGRAVWLEPVVCSPALTACDWYESVGDREKVTWCREILQATLDRDRYISLIAGNVLIPRLIVGWTMTTGLL